MRHDIPVLKHPDGTELARVLLETQEASGSATIDFVLPQGFLHYEILFSGVQPSVDARDLLVRLSNDGGATFESGAGSYQYALRFTGTGGAASGDGSASATSINMFGGAQEVGTAANEFTYGKVTIWGAFGATEQTFILFEHVATGSGTNITQSNGGGRRIGAEINNAIRFLFNTGNIDVGTFKLYGIR